MYKMREANGVYSFFDGNALTLTPMNNKVTASSSTLAERLLNDLNRFGNDPSNPYSIVAFHYPMLDFFHFQSRSELEHSVCIGLNRDYDWTFQCGSADPEIMMNWWSIFGRYDTQLQAGLNWIKGLNLQQLCATTVIGRVLESVNIPFILSTTLKPEGMKDFTNFICKVYPYVDIKDLNKYFDNFLFYFNLEDV